MSNARKPNIISMEKTRQGVVCKTSNSLLSVSFVARNVIRVRQTREVRFAQTSGPICIARASYRGKADVHESNGTISVGSGGLQACIDKTTGALGFLDSKDELLWREQGDSPRVWTEIEIRDVVFDLASAKEITTVDGGRIETVVKEVGPTARAWTVQQNVDWMDGEALYGLGSHEENVLNLRGSAQYVYQQNMKAAVPVLVSSRGYGLLFNAECELEFHDDEEGSFVRLDAVKELDYYVIYGPEFDRIVAGYRDLTGRVPMLPRWAFGYCQSKERYENQRELVGIVEEYRRRRLPLDVVIQDWKYWTQGWGIKSFDSERYPDPSAMCERIHELNARVMISIWPKVVGSEEADEMIERGHMLKNNAIYDAYAEEARAAYWEYANEGLFKHGIDAWWCDCTEPCEADWEGKKKLSSQQRRNKNTTALRELLGRERVNSYSLFHSKGIYKNQRASTEAKRVVNLTRSAYAGQQRYATITWSGDIAARWEVLAQQISCGLNFTVTGCPYWTTDIGAFFVRKKAQWFWAGHFDEGCNDLGYRELYTRWFQFGAFLPMFRSHGTDTPREVWQFGEPGEMFYDTLVKYLELRYRLLPYIYSLAGRTTQEHYTILRLLAFDFREDPDALNAKAQFMFGPAFLVCPVTRSMYYGPGSTPLPRTRKTRSVYLPTGGDWYDFWTGAKLSGGQRYTVPAPIETMPMYVRTGSIIPMGPVVQHTSEKTDAEWTVRVYPGADGVFTVYEDAGDGYGYEKGEFSTWVLRWDEACSCLRIGKRQGAFPGMTRTRKLTIRLMIEPNRVVNVVYTGRAKDISIPSSGGERKTGREVKR